MSDFPLIAPVILCGGEGKRLWPLSRKMFPKQFLSLMEKEKSLFQQTVKRARHLQSSETFKKFRFAPPILVCNQNHAFIAGQQLLELSEKQVTVLVEPVRRDSAPGIAAASFAAKEKYGDPILWIMPSDAFILEDDTWEKAVEQAFKAAAASYLTVFGMIPTHPETGYGYIKRGTPIKGFSHIFKVDKFVEKPNFEKAQEYLKTGKYFWNSGMFVSKASLMLGEFKIYQPEIFACVKKSVEQRRISSAYELEYLEKEAFEQSPALSIDFAIAEHTRHGAVVEAGFTWSDIGSWNSLWENSSKDEEGNVKGENVFLHEVKNSYLRSDGPLIIANDIENLAVVAMADAILVSSRAKAQGIKNCVADLEKAGRPEACESLTTRRPWGQYRVLIKSEGYIVKEIEVFPGHRLSLQKHFHRSEHWVVVSGIALVTRDEERFELKENEGIYIPAGAVHRLENQSKAPLILIETQCGDILQEADIVRLEDDYRRQ